MFHMSLAFPRETPMIWKAPTPYPNALVVLSLKALRCVSPFLSWQILAGLWRVSLWREPETWQGWQSLHIVDSAQAVKGGLLDFPALLRVSITVWGLAQHRGQMKCLARA